MSFKVELPAKGFFTDAAAAVASTTYPDLASAEKAVTDMVAAEHKDLEAAATTLAASADAQVKKVGTYLTGEAEDVGHLVNQPFAKTLDGQGSLFITRRGIVSIVPA